MLGASQEAAELALEMLLWSTDVVLFSNGPREWHADVQEKLTRKRVAIIERCELAEKLGCEFDDGSPCIQSDENGQTCVPGLYAAGNARGGVQLVIAAAAKGTAAAVAMNNALLDSDD